MKRNTFDMLFATNAGRTLIDTRRAAFRQICEDKGLECPGNVKNLLFETISTKPWY